MNKTMLMMALLGSTLMGQDGRLANGAYAVEEGNTKAKGRVVRQYGGKDVGLDTTNFAPFVLAGKPEVQRDPSGSSLMIQLAPDAAKRLEDLTLSQLNRKIAVVVGDKIVSTPTVRGVIKDGKAKIAPCDDESCQPLLGELSK